MSEVTWIIGEWESSEDKEDLRRWIQPDESLVYELPEEEKDS